MTKSAESAGPQRDSGGARPKASKGRLGRLRSLPGFTVAATTFVLVVLLSGGGMAVAQWQQSATATITVTAGAAAVVPPSGPNVVANPAIATRPSVQDPERVRCQSVLPQETLAKATSADIKFTWTAPATVTSYTVSLDFIGTGYTYSQTQVVNSAVAIFKLQRTQAAFGNYALRIQPMNGAAAGDAIYRTYQNASQRSDNCFYLSPDGRSPLGTPVISTTGMVKGDTTASLPITWTAASGATSYVVTLTPKSRPLSTYGLEATVSGPEFTLIFPRAPSDRFGNPANWVDIWATYYGDYTLRIQPMNGSVAGDPVYTIVHYSHWTGTIDG
ncbi:hypothetical protein [Arthrobacter cryoconiti]|uniref:Fibronectin type-III domain-containing protein n=1 Tax=Arthrobacter cryoconiti TaxID=748907 RepID=A0ABV8R5V6_9MICC|nr:hypothetical protein [Arthrobacter cryoconiti]MCC9067032.1 hypothetical protein [Arthrobacter cryoconiti]